MTKDIRCASGALETSLSAKRFTCVAKRGRHRRNWRENERQIASVRKRTGHRGCLICFYPEFVYGISLKWDEKTEKKNSITFQKDAIWCLKAHAWKKSNTYVSHYWARHRHGQRARRCSVITVLAREWRAFYVGWRRAFGHLATRTSTRAARARRVYRGVVLPRHVRLHAHARPRRAQRRGARR